METVCALWGGDAQPRARIVPIAAQDDKVLVLFNKPFRVLSQFRDPEGRRTLGDYIDVPGVYPAGRLDYDSEGLMLLTDDGRLQARIADPRGQTRKTYRAQVEGVPTRVQLDELVAGVSLKDGPARAVSARHIAEPFDLWRREPPIRYRKNVADSWIEIVLTEGRNRQVRRMTAAVGLPTLRLIRSAIGDWTLDGLQPGEWREVRAPRSA
jgi:23S rRNA pseudouridine2457 synthase